MDREVQARLDKGIRSLEKELARKGMFENAGRKQERDFRDWLGDRRDMPSQEMSEALATFDAAVDLAQDRFIAARNKRG